ncbi:MAG: ABC transporter substrate-binding protein [Merismopedia sp. SIO2A8]|nr:ABC transporter substrate-binding protein [Merismopedia sp. SIO2A8]
MVQVGSVIQRWVQRSITGLLIIVMAIATSSCNLDAFKTSSARIPQIVYSTISEPKTFNPVLNDVATIIFNLLSEGLLSENGLTGELEPAMAESWTVSDDQKEIVFTLRPDLKWSDGQPLTVDDILFTYNDVLFNPQIPSSIRDILRIGEEGLFPSVEKVSDRQIKFSVPEPFAPFLRYAGGISILPKHVLADTISATDSEGNPTFLSTWATDTDPNDLIGSGPYRMVRYVPGERMVFEKNPYYWRQDDQQRSQPYIDRFVIQIVESTDAALIQFRSGGLDMLQISEPRNFALLKREEERGNFTIYEGGLRPGTSFISFNLNTGKRKGEPLVDPLKSRWFNTKEFRQAVSYAIDRQTMINNLFQGLGEPQSSPLSVQSPYFIGPEDGLKTYDYNRDKAKELLLSQGFRYDADDRLVDADGNPVRFTLITNTGNKLREAMGAQVKRDLSKIGIQVDFQLLDFNTLVERVSNSLKWDCLLLGFTG